MKLWVKQKRPRWSLKVQGLAEALKRGLNEQFWAGHSGGRLAQTGRYGMMRAMSDTEIANEPRRKRRQVIAVAALGIALLGQGLYSFATRPEPYPTVRMPGFGDAPTPSGMFANSGLEVTVRLKDGTELHPNPVDLAGDLRYSAARASLDYAFKPGADGERNPRSTDPEVLDWLSTRTMDLGGQPASEVEFCWRKAVIDITDGTVTRPGECEVATVKL